MKQILIFTDLDGTLLDYRSYSHKPAQGALRRADDLNIPVIINSSKTAAEIRELRERLGNIHPFIVENGGAVIVPADYFREYSGMDYVEVFGSSYDQILSILSELRENHRFRFKGFNDFSDEQLTRMTGLSKEQAHRAKQRIASEPILWKSSEADRGEFENRLEQFGLALVRGGRFFHVMGRTDKGVGLEWLVNRYRADSRIDEFLTIALGDSPNDEAMLRRADIAVVVKPVADNRFNFNLAGSIIYSTKPGPEGWNEAVNRILDQHY